MKEKYRDREKKSVCFSQRLIEMGTLGQQGEVCVCGCVCVCVYLSVALSICVCV